MNDLPAGPLALATFFDLRGWPGAQSVVGQLVYEGRRGHWPCPTCSTWVEVILHEPPAREIAGGAALRCLECRADPVASALATPLLGRLSGAETLARVLAALDETGIAA